MLRVELGMTERKTEPECTWCGDTGYDPFWFYKPGNRDGSCYHCLLRRAKAKPEAATDVTTAQADPAAKPRAR